jgi:ribosome-binding protein aMBF1 (putative translation factor)
MADLEERTVESLPDRCESCGATLTTAEKQRILDEGAAMALCTTCAAEAEAVPDEALDEESDAAY